MDNLIEYIPNNRFNSTLLNQANLNHDGHDVCYNGLLFKRQRINKNSINWLCKVINCPGSITLKIANDEIQHYVPHELVRFMNRRRQKEYDIVLKALKKEAKARKLELKPLYIMTDYEQAAINAFKENFAGIESFFFLKSIDSYTIHISFCNGCDLGGYDITEFPSTGLDDCWNGCLSNPSCTFFAFLKLNNNCWLKNKPDIDFSQFNDDINYVSGIVDRSKSCSAIEDFSPNHYNCTLYYRCFAGFLQHLGCLNGKYFDPILKTCTLNSTCPYVCKNNQDLVGIINKNNEYYNCLTQKIETCKSSGRFDIIQKKCIGMNKNIFKNKQTSGNYGLIESTNFKSKFLCFAWCMNDSNCKMVLYKNFSCQKFDVTNNNFMLNGSLVYYPQF
ncbi:unnamed protein product [Brachionus calyciflorus]|uniref:Uncharacterized protein n=1 Tax=Brachionus calyciflorus TaxID=104777 RepID=A0A814J2C2_9BILA|nr:unnamed protein product [Brachionus calyciflorus]